MKQNQLVELRRQQVEISKQVIVENHRLRWSRFASLPGRMSLTPAFQPGFCRGRGDDYRGWKPWRNGVQGVLEFPIFPAFSRSGFR